MTKQRAGRVAGFLYLLNGALVPFSLLLSKHALLMLVLVLLSAPISFGTELDRIGALTLSQGSGYLSVLDQRRLAP